MASFSSVSNVAVKRQKTAGIREITPTAARNSGAIFESHEFFPDIGRAEFRPDSSVEEYINFRYYNAADKIHGRSLEEWIRPAISFHHVVYEYYPRGFQVRKVFEESFSQNSVESFKKRIRAVFELGQKLGVKYYTASDVDFAPEGDSLEDFHRYLDENVTFVLELQQKTGITPLWIKPTFFSHNQYRHSEISEVIHKGAQLKKALEIAQKLGAENFLVDEIEAFELFSTTDFTKNFRQYARLLKLATEYKEHLGYRGQLLLQPNYVNQKSFSKFSTASNAVAFLKNYNLDRSYKLSVRPGYDLKISLVYNLFGSLEATDDTFPPDSRGATLLMKTILDHGGTHPGGLNIGIKSSPKSDLKDVFVGYVSALDAYAKALKVATKIISDGVLTNSSQLRYSGFQSGLGSRFISGEVSLEDLSEQSKRIGASGEAYAGQGQGPNYWAAFYSRYTLD